MPRSADLDPLDRFRWRIYVVHPSGHNFVRAGFSSCSSPGVTLIYKEYREGGKHMNPLQIHEGATFKPITLTRGIIAKTDVNDFAKWMDAAFKVLKGEEGAVQYRRDIVIEHLDRDANPIKRFLLNNCVPTNYEVASDFRALDDSEHSVESLTFSYEGFSETTVQNFATATELIKGLI